MQTKKEILTLLERFGAKPRKQFGQCFLIDTQLMDKVLDLAELTGCETVLEVGPGTGSLSDELVRRADRVVAVEIDRKLSALLRKRFEATENFRLIEGDVLASKSRIAPGVLEAVAPKAQLVANLPYNIATSLIANCLIESWRSLAGEGVCFERLTFTVQREVAERMAAVGGGEYGPVSVLIGLLGKITLGRMVPAKAFWPVPKIASQIVRIDFDPAQSALLKDLPTLQALLSMVFTQRRKRILGAAKARGAAFRPDVLAPALESAGIDPSVRAEEISPEAYGRLANCLKPE